MHTYYSRSKSLASSNLGSILNNLDNSHSSSKDSAKSTIQFRLDYAKSYGFDPTKISVLPSDAAPNQSFDISQKVDGVDSVIQRKIKAEKDFPNRGKLSIDMKEEFAKEDGRFGEAGNIRFSPAEEGENASEIVLTQAVRNVLPQKDYAWRREQTPREFMKTKGNDTLGIEPNWFIDHDASKTQPRKKAGERPIRSDYNATIPVASGDERKGYKIGKNVQDVVLYDHSAANVPMKWDFETAVIASNSDSKNIPWGSVKWGFETEKSKDEWIVKNEKVSFSNGVSKTFEAALDAFNKYYRNIESSTAPELLEEALLQCALAANSKGKFSIEYLSALAKVNRYLIAFQQLIDTPMPDYEGSERSQNDFVQLRQIYQELVSFASSQLSESNLQERANQHEKTQSSAISQPLNSSSNTTVDEMQVEETEENKINRLRQERQARMEAIRLKHQKPKTDNT